MGTQISLIGSISMTEMLWVAAAAAAEGGQASGRQGGRGGRLSSVHSVASARCWQKPHCQGGTVDAGPANTLLCVAKVLDSA